MPRNRKRKAISSRIARGAKRYKSTRTPKYRRAGPRHSMSFRRSRFTVAVQRAINRVAEVKECLVQVTSNQTLLHNVVTNIWNNPFQTQRGTDGEGNSTQGVRIGNKIYIKRLRMSIMIESQQYRPLCNYWLYLVRLKGANMDTTINSASQMFEQTTTSIPLDFLDSSKCDILYVKKFTLRMPNPGTLATVGSGFDGTQPPGAQVGGTTAGQTNERITNPQVIKKFNVPINTTVVYRDTHDSNNNIPATYRYQWVMIAYDNFTSSTGTSTYPVGHVTMTQKMTFTDI